jgi:hypothetical protein
MTATSPEALARKAEYKKKWRRDNRERLREYNKKYRADRPGVAAMWERACRARRREREGLPE